MKITECFTISKQGLQEKNEDALYIGERFVVVADGVTPKTPAPSGVRVSAGRFAAQTVCALAAAMPDLTDPEEIVEYLNTNLKKAISESPYSGQKEPPAASVILYDGRMRQVVSYGDCQLLYRGQAYRREKVLDRICARKRADILSEAIRNGETTEALLRCDVGRKAIEPDILGSFLRYANQEGTYGFPVLGTGEIVSRYIDVYPVQPGEEIVLASDGFPVLRATLSESEVLLERIIRKDPLLIREYQSTKGVTKGNISYDDRTYVRFTTAGDQPVP